MARRLKTIARWVNQNLGQYGYRATVNSKDYNYSVGNYYGGNVVGYHGSRTGTLFTCWELTDLEDINDEPNAYRRRNLKTFGNVGGVWRKIKSHNSAEPYRNNTQVEDFVRRLVAKVRQENPDAEVADYEAEELASEFTGMKRDSKKSYARKGMKRHYERMGIIPSPMGLAAYRRKIEVPKGFKYAQLGFLALVVGALTVSEMRKRE